MDSRFRGNDGALGGWGRKRDRGACGNGATGAPARRYGSSVRVRESVDTPRSSNASTATT